MIYITVLSYPLIDIYNLKCLTLNQLYNLKNLYFILDIKFVYNILSKTGHILMFFKIKNHNVYIKKHLFFKIISYSFDKSKEY